MDTFGFLHFTWIDILDILMVAALIYLIFRWIRGTSAINIFIAIIILLIVKVVVSALGMRMVSSLLGTVIDVGALAIIVIFQPEIRKFLYKIGRSAGKTIGKNSFIFRLIPHKGGAKMETADISEIVEACKVMSKQQTGALIVIRHRDSLDDVIETGDRIDAMIRQRLIRNIFFKNSPLHDGAMIIGNDRIIAARCTLPITDRMDLPAHFGMRHKAAVGMSEQCDADIIVVSEQTGGVSFVRAGEITPIKSFNVLKLMLSGTAEEGEEKK